MGKYSHVSARDFESLELLEAKSIKSIAFLIQATLY